MGAPELQNWSPKGPRKLKPEKVTSTEAQHIDKLKIIKKERIQSGNVDSSFIFTTEIDKPQEN